MPREISLLEVRHYLMQLESMNNCVRGTILVAGTRKNAASFAWPTT